ncbi:MAG: hypothetical protein R6W92_08910, partial [Desulfocurvibacter africanus]
FQHDGDGHRNEYLSGVSKDAHAGGCSYGLQGTLLVGSFHHDRQAAYGNLDVDNRGQGRLDNATQLHSQAAFSWRVE